MIDGMLPVHKPAGMISKDISRWMIRRFGKLSIGHVGTLDPGASGVLPLLLGRATKLQDGLLALPKTYEFEMTLGYETDTLDRDGTIIKRMPTRPLKEDEVLALMSQFKGEIDQIPPTYSAVKYRGKPLYQYVRSDKLDHLPSLDQFKRRVSVHEFELLSLKEEVGQFRVRCSKGTYIRSLVRDIAEKLGTCATLTKLIRTEAAGVELSQAYDLETIESHAKDLTQIMIPIKDLSQILSPKIDQSLSLSRLKQCEAQALGRFG